VLLTIVVVAAIGALLYVDETNRSEAALDDLGNEQAAVARAAGLALASGRSLESIEHAGSVVVLIAEPSGELSALDDQRVVAPRLTAAIAGGARIVRLAPAEAQALGLPERTAMVGIARTPKGRFVAVASTAEHQRDRDRQGLMRVLLGVLLAAGVTSGFAAVIWRKQRAQAELARELAIAETARSRDAELDRLSRAATMAALTSGIAHELATPLGVIAGRAEQLLARVKDDERAAKNAQLILDQVGDIDRVVRGLLGLARGTPIALQPVPPRTLVREAAALVEHRFERAHVALLPAVGEVPDVRCEPQLLKHALVNLLLNACDAARGEVRVDVSADAAEVAFIVTDDGDGITPEHAERAIEPFFTTKSDGGTGLGLAIANEIVKTHRGSLDIAPTSPRGTRACIRIPIEAA